MKSRSIILFSGLRLYLQMGWCWKLNVWSSLSTLFWTRLRLETLKFIIIQDKVRFDLIKFASADPKFVSIRSYIIFRFLQRKRGTDKDLNRFLVKSSFGFPPVSNDLLEWVIRATSWMCLALMASKSKAWWEKAIAYGTLDTFTLRRVLKAGVTVIQILHKCILTFATCMTVVGVVSEFSYLVKVSFGLLDLFWFLIDLTDRTIIFDL